MMHTLRLFYNADINLLPEIINIGESDYTAQNHKVYILLVKLVETKNISLHISINVLLLLHYNTSLSKKSEIKCYKS